MMGALDEGHFCEELENGVKLEDPETLASEDAVRVLLEGLGAREGLRKTPLRVAKAFREGTRGAIGSTSLGYVRSIVNLMNKP